VIGCVVGATAFSGQPTRISTPPSTGGATPAMKFASSVARDNPALAIWRWPGGSKSIVCDHLQTI
jgi:hypothetical protein